MLDGKNVLIGDFIINNVDNDDSVVSIFHKSGEGGVFDKEKFRKAVADAVKQLYDDEF